MKFICVYFSPFFCLFYLIPKYISKYLFSISHYIYSSLNVRDQVSHPHTAMGRVTVLCVVFLDSEQEDIQRFINVT